MKKLLVVFSLIVMSALVVTPAIAKPVTLVYAEVNPLDTIVGQVGTLFKQKVEELGRRSFGNRSSDS